MTRPPIATRSVVTENRTGPFTVAAALVIWPPAGVWAIALSIRFSGSRAGNRGQTLRYSHNIGLDGEPVRAGSTGLPMQVILLGIERTAIFIAEGDYRVFSCALAASAENESVRFQAQVLPA
jgi:hypothetical protein